MNGGDRFAKYMNRGSGDKEVDAMRSELDVYYDIERKEQIKQDLIAMRKKHGKDLDADAQAEAHKFQQLAENAGFVIKNMKG